MDYLKTVRSLLLASQEELRPYQQAIEISPANAALVPFMKVPVPVLPGALQQTYLFPTPEDAVPQGTFATILRRVNDTERVRRLDFYSTWYEHIYFPNPAPVAEELKETITQTLRQHHWKLTNTVQTEHVQYLVFTQQGIELTVLFDVLADVRLHPFWDQLLPLNISYPAEHIPSFRRYLHFIYRLEIPEKKC